jgi:hypothetical protein
MFFLSNQLTINSIMDDFHNKIEQLKVLSQTHADDSREKEIEAKQLLAQSEASKQESERATVIADNLQAIVGGMSIRESLTSR